MTSNLLKYLILCVVILLNIKLSIGSLKCSYSDQNNKIQIGGNTPGYTCSLSINPKNLFWEKIEGSHENLKNDSEVKFVKKFFDLRSNPKKQQQFSNSLKELKSEICKKFKNLEGIHLDRTGIKEIDPTAFQDCKQLTSLGLGSNNIYEIDENLLYTNSKLTNLWLSGNKLSSIPSNFLSSQSELEILEILNNKLSNLPDNLFDSTAKLRDLNLQNNKIQNLNPEWFKKLHSLEDLDISHNKISQFSKVTFSTTNNIKRLYLNNNAVNGSRVTLSKVFFDLLTNLIFLDLSSNRIFLLPDRVFNGLTNLKYLDISLNSLTEVHFNSFGSKKHLDVVNFDNNPLTAIDAEFIKKTNISKIMMAENRCSGVSLFKKDDMNDYLKDCYLIYDQKYRIGQPNRAIPNIENCGKTSFLKSTILWGQDVSRKEYPWVVAIKHVSIGFICGGTLVSRRNVVTAAHCIHDKNQENAFKESELTVIAGAYNLSKSHEEGTQSVAVKSILTHSQWNRKFKSFDADIAMLELNQELLLSDYIQPICLIDPNSDVPFVKKGIIVGYGIDEHKNNGIQKSMTSPIIDHIKCMAKNQNLEDLLGPRSFCGGYGNGTGSCSGDSGSGLFVVYDNTFYLRGIVAASLNHWEYGCDVRTHSVFTDVIEFHEWVKNEK